MAAWFFETVPPVTVTDAALGVEAAAAGTRSVLGEVTFVSSTMLSPSLRMPAPSPSFALSEIVELLIRSVPTFSQRAWLAIALAPSG